jgi:hypothetical protein
MATSVYGVNVKIMHRIHSPKTTTIARLDDPRRNILIVIVVVEVEGE